MDSVTATAIPVEQCHAVLAYVDGDYQTWGPLHEILKPYGTLILSVTVDVKPGADIADCERGNAGPSEVAFWAKSELKARRRPTIYGSVDYLRQCAQELRSLRINPSLVDWFLADYVQVAPALAAVKWPRELPHGYVGWQFADSIPVGGHTIDASVISSVYAKQHGYPRTKEQAQAVPLKQSSGTTASTTLTSTTPTSTPAGWKFLEAGWKFLEAGWYENAEHVTRVG
jgi:hypothetical protein